MAYYHGVNTAEKESGIITPATVSNGITFAVGTAPVHMAVSDNVNRIILASTFDEAKNALGYSDDWKKYTLCEIMKTHFELYGISPVMFVNVLDPTIHKKEAGGSEFEFDAAGKITLSYDVIPDTVVISSESGGIPYVQGVDYLLYTDGGSLVAEKLSGGSISTSGVFISYSEIDFALITERNIIGGTDTESGNVTGLELIDSALTVCGEIPEFICAPAMSMKPEVAAVMSTKAKAINGMFKGKALIDVDTDAVTNCKDVAAWKDENGINGTNQILCFPMLSGEGKKYHMSSHLAAVMAVTDTANNGVPDSSPSGRPLAASGTVAGNGEIDITLSAANALNEIGVVTALNFVNGFVAWGNCTACYPEIADVKDYFISVNRMFAYMAKYLIYSYWGSIDGKMTPRLIESIVDGVNVWINGLVADGHLLGGRIVCLSAENPLENLIAGKLKFHIYATPPSPVTEIDFVLEYDADYISAMFAE